MALLKPAAALDRLRKVHDEGQGLSTRADIDAWRERARLAIAAAYGDGSSQLKRFDDIRYSLGMWTDSTPQSAFDSASRGGLRKALNMVAACIEDRESSLDHDARELAPGPEGTAVFVVHGHHEALKVEVARLLERLHLKPIILHEQPNGGRTVIEKFEDHALKAGFAIALLTADDVGHAKGASVANDRARQNVILELGYFMGALGRHRTVALIEDGVEKPSDLAGLVYVFTSPGWPLEVARELKSAGLPVDLNDLM